MSNPIKTVFKDACFKPNSGASDLSVDGDGASKVKGDFEVNGQKVIIGIGLHPDIVDPEK
jgi:hypothetical protein